MLGTHDPNEASPQLAASLADHFVSMGVNQHLVSGKTTG